MFKLHHSEEWSPLPCRFNKKVIIPYDELPQLHRTPISIDGYKNILPSKYSGERILYRRAPYLYQNRDVIVSNALHLLKFEMDNKVTVNQKYFEKGRSQMEVDFVHSAIECRFNIPQIYLPTALCTEARSKKPRINMIRKYMKYTDLRDYTKVNYNNCISPG
nr:unnamed protein product [Callosobruchus chinensis]